MLGNLTLYAWQPYTICLTTLHYMLGNRILYAWQPYTICLATLHYMLGNLALCALENGMKINVDKTKCMIFNKSGKFIRNKFQILK